VITARGPLIGRTAVMGGPRAFARKVVSVVGAEHRTLAGGSLVAESDERVRRRLAVEAPRRELVVDGVRVSYRVWRDATPSRANVPTVVLVHGNAARTEWWDAIAPGLLPAGDVIALDLSGHGESQWKEVYDFSDWSREVVAVLEREGSTEDVILVGHSMGGLVCLKTAWEHPSSVRAVILLDTPFRRFTAKQQEKRVAIAARPLPRYDTFDEAVDGFKTAPALVRRQDDVWDHVARSSYRRDPDGWVLHFDPSLYARVTDVDRFVRQFPPQTYLVRAEQGLITDRMLEEMLPCLPGRDYLITVPGAGHNLLLEFPCATTELILALLGRM
jgi:pimeloyl-ACP methyl ester carboxylesterase